VLGDYRGGVFGIGATLAAPFWALWLLWVLYRAARFGMRMLREAGWQEWNGRYYEFDGRQVRILFDGEAVWFAAADVFDALGTEPDARDPERVRHIVGRDGLRQAPDSSLLCFSEKGLAAWLDRRTERTATQFARWLIPRSWARIASAVSGIPAGRRQTKTRDDQRVRGATVHGAIINISLQYGRPCPRSPGSSRSTASPSPVCSALRSSWRYSPLAVCGRAHWWAVGCSSSASCWRPSAWWAASGA